MAMNEGKVDSVIEERIGNHPQKNILYFNTSEFFGPPQQVHGQVIKHLNEKDYKIYVATNSRGDSGERFRNLGNCIVKEFYLSGTFQGGSSLKRLRLLFSLIPVMFSIVKILRFISKENISLIHCAAEPRPLIFGAILGMFSKAKLVFHEHVEAGTKGKLNTRIERFSLRRADRVIAISEFVKSSVVRLGVSHSKVDVVLNVVDLEKFRPDTDGSAIRKEFGIATDSPLIVTVGRITKVKGQIDLIEAMATVRAEFPDAKALIIGWSDPAILPSGKSYFEELQDYCARSGLVENIVFGEARPDVQYAFAAADIVVIPSRWQEPLGLVVIEAMSSGKPVISTKGGGIPELITSGTGILVPIGRSDEIAQEILKLLKQPDLRSDLSKAGRNRAEQGFYETRASEEVAKVYERMLV